MQTIYLLQVVVKLFSKLFILLSHKFSQKVLKCFFSNEISKKLFTISLHLKSPFF